jgi:hypothetical protein
MAGENTAPAGDRQTGRQRISATNCNEGHTTAVDVPDHDANVRNIGSTVMSAKLQKLIDASRGRDMTAAEKEAQRRSFAYGNAHIENSRVTREMVDEAAEKLGRK